MSNDAPAWEKRDDHRPPENGEVALVKCNGYRCMAYRDRQGKWRNYFRGEELQGEVQIIRMIE